MAWTRRYTSSNLGADLDDPTSQLSLVRLGAAIKGSIAIAESQAAQCRVSAWAGPWYKSPHAV